MANFTYKALIGAIKNAHNESLELTWFSDALGNDVCHFGVCCQDGTSQGFGTAFSLEEAILKAYSEHIERRCLQELSSGARSSNGFAVHTDPSSSESNAIGELIERDIFLCGWFLKQPPRWLFQNEVRQLGFDRQWKTFHDSGFDLRVGIVGSSGGFTCVVVALFSLTGPLEIGFTIETAAAKDIRAAISSAILTQRRAATLIINRIREGRRPYQPMAASDVAQPRDHLEFYLNPEHMREVQWYFENGQEILLPDCEIQTQEFKILFETAWELSIFRAVSERMQDFVAGRPDLSLVNERRLREVFPHYATGTAYMEIHPLS